jgi:cyclopropane fatty-acyl-phospholipid synthase-like methyltransferase
VYAFNKIGVEAKGVEMSQYAVNHRMDENIEQGDVLSYRDHSHNYDLVIAYDLLEHISEEDLERAIYTLKYHAYNGGYILISVPMIGDPNLYKDTTHKIFWTRAQWEEKLRENNLKIIDVPEHWQFRNQLILCEVEK